MLDELVDQDFAVVPDRPFADASVMELVMDGSAAAGIVIVVLDQAIAVSVLDMLSAEDPTTGGFLALEGAGHGSHRGPSYRELDEYPIPFRGCPIN
jgi:hypothetical protein